MQFVPKEQLADYIGVEGEPSDWLEIDQDRINKFADATMDHQFIHIDPEQAAKTPFGSTIAHGFLSLSMVTYLATFRAVAPEGLVMAINYGSDKVRFITPVKSGQRIRARSVMQSADEKNPGQILVKNLITIDIDGEPKPALVAEILSMYVVG
ncbi:MAG: MaoC family dehydratase [Pseudomonadota bacterium]